MHFICNIFYRTLVISTQRYSHSVRRGETRTAHSLRQKMTGQEFATRGEHSHSQRFAIAKYDTDPFNNRSGQSIALFVFRLATFLPLERTHSRIFMRLSTFARVLRLINQRVCDYYAKNYLTRVVSINPSDAVTHVKRGDYVWPGEFRK